MTRRGKVLKHTQKTLRHCTIGIVNQVWINVAQSCLGLVSTGLLPLQDGSDTETLYELEALNKIMYYV